jgi:hypothetical protein
MPSSNRNINPYSPNSSYENNKMSNNQAQRPDFINQQLAKSIRPQLPRDGSANMTRWSPGELPKGGFRSVFDFSGTPSYDTKHSPTSGGGKKVY